MQVKRPAHHLSQSRPSVNTGSLLPAVPEKVESGFLRQETFPEFLSPAGASNRCPSPDPKVGEVVKAPEKQGCLGLTSYPPSTSAPVSQTSVTSAPLVPTEPLEHNDKAPAGAAKGPPLTDDNKVRLTLGGTYLPGTGWKGSLGDPRFTGLRRIHQPVERAPE